MPPRKVSNIERKAQRKRQTRLTFDPLEKSSSPAAGMSPTNVRYQLPGNRRTPKSTTEPDNQDEDGESEDILTISNKKFGLTSSKSRKTSGSFKTLPTPAKSSQPGRISLEDDDESEDDPFQSATKVRSTQRDRLFGSGIKRDHGDSSEGSEPEESFITPSKRKRNTPKGKARASVSVESDDEDEIPHNSPWGRASQSSITKLEPKPITTSDDNEYTTGNDSEDILAPSSTRRSLRVATPRHEIDDEDEDEEPVTSPLKRPRMVALSSDSESDVVSPTKRGRITSKSKSPITPSRITRQQNTRRHRTAKEKTMELLKRKRAGEDINELTESEMEEEEARGAYDTESDLQALSEFEDEEESPEQVKDRRHKRNTIRRRKSGPVEDHYDSEFVVDDDDAPLGVPDMSLYNIPLQFTHAAHKPLKEHFKDAVEWMVHNKVNPGFARNDPVYRQAFSKLNDEYETLAKSKFTSTQWTRDFTKALHARPVMEVRDLDYEEKSQMATAPKCDACNHRSHVPSVVISFSGRAYNKDTLEEIDQDSDSDSDVNSTGDEDEDDDDGKVSIDDNGAEIPNTSTEWLTGRICHENAQTAHMLIHWKHALKEWVFDSLENEGLLEPAKLAARDKMKPKQRLKDANNIVDTWEANNQIRNLYRDFKAQLEAAREAKSGRFDGGAGRYIRR